MFKMGTKSKLIPDLLDLFDSLVVEKCEYSYEFSNIKVKQLGTRWVQILVDSGYNVTVKHNNNSTPYYGSSRYLVTLGAKKFNFNMYFEAVDMQIRSPLFIMNVTGAKLDTTRASLDFRLASTGLYDYRIERI